MDRGFRALARELEIPALPSGPVALDLLQLYYVRLGFLASAYINQVGIGIEPARVLPRNIAVPLCEVSHRLGRPPILSYDGYALANWKRFRPDTPVALGNIDTIQNFVHLYDEHWFILVHVEIEARASVQIDAIEQIERALAASPPSDEAAIDTAVGQLAAALWDQVGVLKRIPEHMDPALYYKTFRPYIRFFEDVVYEGVDAAPMHFRGETGAQSSLIPMIVAVLKVPHRATLLTEHLADMRRFMPAEHRAWLEHVEGLPDVRGHVARDTFNNALEALATFRETHLDFARRYIAQWVADPRGTGGTPYLRWLQQLVDETRAYQVK